MTAVWCQLFGHWYRDRNTAWHGKPVLVCQRCGRTVRL